MNDQDAIQRAKIKYAQQIEDGRKISAFTTMPEWNWYVESVIKPTVDDYTQRILSGQLKTNKEDWIMRGMITGMKLIIETPENFEATAKHAKKQAKAQAEYLKDEE